MNVARIIFGVIYLLGSIANITLVTINGSQSYIGFADATFSAQFPFANVRLEDEGSPVAVEITGWSFTNNISDDFTINQDNPAGGAPVILLPGDSYVLDVEFSAAVQGSYTDTLIINTDVGDYNLTLIGQRDTSPV